MTGTAPANHATAAARLEILSLPSDSHALDSLPAPDGRRLFRAIPRGEAPAAGWPTLYLLDGNAAFDALTSAMLAAVPGLMVVGVGYDSDRQFARERRTLDYTPPDGPGDGIRPDHVHEGRMCGGLGRFLDALTGPLRTLAEGGQPIAARTLWGHSFGGLAVLGTRMLRPGAFDAHATISPSVWWDAPLMDRLADSAAPAATPMLAALSDAEQRTGSIGPPPIGPAPATMALLARWPDAELTVFRGLRHIETLAASLPLTLDFAARQGARR